jgi:hypothetical protein
MAYLPPGVDALMAAAYPGITLFNLDKIWDGSSHVSALGLTISS